MKSLFFDLKLSVLGLFFLAFLQQIGLHLATSQQFGRASRDLQTQKPSGSSPPYAASSPSSSDGPCASVARPSWRLSVGPTIRATIGVATDDLGICRGHLTESYCAWEKFRAIRFIDKQASGGSQRTERDGSCAKTRPSGSWEA